MQHVSFFQLIGFGPNGWGAALIAAAGVTVGLAICGFLIGAVIGTVIAWAKISGNLVQRSLADGYTTVLRAVPDLLVIYLFYFGGSSLLGAVGSLFGVEGFVSMPVFATGALAIGVVSAAYQSEVFRGAFSSIARGEIEAGRSMGMPTALMFRRIIAPQVLRFALPGMGNIWQLVLKESALISVIGLVELLRQAQIGAGSTRRPFEFFLTAAAIYVLITFVSTAVFRYAEHVSQRGVRRAG